MPEMANARSSFDNKPHRYLPIYIPLMSVTLLLAVLFSVGYSEQLRLQDEHVARVLSTLAAAEQQVAERIRLGVGNAEKSALRVGQHLSQAISSIAPSEHMALEQQFDRRMAKRSDGSTRMREPFDGSASAATVLPNYLAVSADVKHVYMRLMQVTDEYGAGAQEAMFVNIWVLPLMGGETIFWATDPKWQESPTADFDYRQTEWVTLVNPSTNPDNKARWTPMSFDPFPKIWMMSVLAPVFRDDVWFGSAGHDLPLSKLLEDTTPLRQIEGSGFVLLTVQDVLLASDRFAGEIVANSGALNLAQTNDPIWLDAVSKVRQLLADDSRARHVQVSLPAHRVFASKIPGQNWLLVNIVPLAPIAGPIATTFATLRNVTFLAFALELLITTSVLWWNYRTSRQYWQIEHNAKQALADSEERFRSLVANVPGIVYRCANDENWTMHFISSECQSITGYPAQDFIQNQIRSFSSVMHPDDRDRVTQCVEAALARPDGWSVEYRIIRADGDIIWVYEQGLGVWSADGKLLYLDGVIIDINDRKRAEQSLREINEELEARVRARTTELQTANAEMESFSYTVSHDLRAPLRHMLSFLQVLRDDLGELTSESLTMLNRIENAGHRMNSLIDALLALSRLGREGLNVESIALKPLIEKIMAELNNAAVEWRCSDLPTVRGDSRLLQQVFANVLGNAVKYSSKRARIEIDIAQRPELAGPSEVVIAVRDNGAGFSNEHAGNLFKMFQRLHLASEFPGEGIGLALSCKIVQLHGGRIWAESEPDKGACFFIALPIKSVRG